MHVVVAVVIAAVIGYLLYRHFAGGQANPGAEAAPRSDRRDSGFAFLSNGLIFCRPPGRPLEQVHSPYAQEALDRRERSHERNSWKKGTSFGIAAGGGMRSFEAPDKPMVATSAVYEAGGDLLYFLKDAGMGGLFRRQAGTGNELRVLLKQHLDLCDLSPSPDGTKIAAGSQQPTGGANIVLFEQDGSKMRDVTGGDTIDTSPAWIPDAPHRLLFQSAGLARGPEGYIVAQGHASIQMLDMTSGTVDTVLEDPRYDHLRPRVAPGGDLLFIRRPYEIPRYGAGNALLDTLLFPFRLLRALFHYLNFFSLMYSRKPLTSASGPAVQADMKNILLQGKRIDAEKALRSERAIHGVPSLVPSSWQLIRRDRNGNERVLATNVVSYDIGADGSVIYSNGRGVFVIDDTGAEGLVLSDQLVGEVIALRS